MRCEQCKVDNKFSSVYPQGCSSTLMGHSPYYDEQGIYHNHDPNWITEGYKCSNGHMWTEKYKHQCPAPGCSHGR